MTARLHPLRRTSSALSWPCSRSACGGPLPQRPRTDRRGHRRHRPRPAGRREPCACSCRFPADSEVDLTGVEVTMGGKDAEAEAVGRLPEQLSKRTSILAIDTSASMRGTRIAEAKKAALAYLSAVPANVRGRRPDLRRHRQPAGAAEPRPRRRPQRGRRAAAHAAALRCTTESSARSMQPDRAAPRPASARSWSSPTARTPPPRRWTTWSAEIKSSDGPGQRRLAAAAGTRRTRH